MSDFTAARRNMVDCQVRPSDVTDLRVIDAMLAVPREMFVPADKRALAYLDLDIDVGGSGKDRRFLIKPAVLARMLQAADIKPTDRVLAAGCASGYSAAVLSLLAGQVFAIEDDADLARLATSTLAETGMAGVSVSHAPASNGDEANGSYDVIVLDGATEVFPNGLCSQLKPAGRLVGVFATQRPPRAVLVTRSANDFGNRALFDATAPVLPGMGTVPAFAF